MASQLGAFQNSIYLIFLILGVPPQPPTSGCKDIWWCQLRLLQCKLCWFSASPVASWGFSILGSTKSLITYLAFQLLASKMFRLFSKEEGFQAPVNLIRPSNAPPHLLWWFFLISPNSQTQSLDFSFFLGDFIQFLDLNTFFMTMVPIIFLTFDL